MNRLALLFLLVLPACARALTLTPSDDGITVDAGTTGQLTFRYPVLSDAAGKETHKIIQKSSRGKSTTVTYEGGTTLEITATDAGEVRFQFSSVLDDTKHWRVDTLIPILFAQGGKWKIGSKEDVFPAAAGPNPHLFQGQGNTFEITDARGVKLVFEVPAYSYLELNDNRFWHWPVFACAAHVPFNRDQLTAVFKVHIDAAAATSDAQVDALGQLKAADWPDKVHSLAELQAGVAAEAAYYDALKPPAFDAFGGLPGSKEKLGLQATGFFHVEKKADNRWFLADPAGNVFFHLGVCVVHPTDDWTTVAGRESIYDWLPPKDGEFKTAYMPGNPGVFSFHLANMIRKYHEPYTEDTFARRMIPRFRKWGFNSVGAFSPIPGAVQALGTPYASSLPLSAYGEFRLPDLPGVRQTWDPYDETNRRHVEQAFAKNLPSAADDPLLIGYFLTNEPIYEDLPRVVPSLDGGKFACKRALVDSLRRKYPTVDAFNKAWELSAKSFDELNAAPLIARTRPASEDVQAFVGEFFETYFKLVADTFHQYDRHHLLLGCRLQPGTINNETLCRAAGRHMDVMSFNYYTTAIDPDFLGRIQRWTGLPMMLSEFFFSSPRDSGLLGGAEVNTQAERGLAYRQYVEQGAATGYVVGIEWFTLVDQSSTGRWFEKFGGERANTGLISVTDRPWKPMLAEMMKTNYGIYEVALGRQKPFVYDDPRFYVSSGATRTADAPRAKGSITLDGNTANWPGIPPNLVPGSRLTVGSDAGGLEGTFRVCWDDRSLYLLVNVKDPTPMQNKNAPARLWSGDGVEVFLGTEGPDEGGPLKFLDRQLLIGAAGAGAAPFFYGKAPDQPACDARVFNGPDGYTVEAAIPWKALGANPQAGQTMRFDLGIDDSTDGTSRRAQIMWSGGAKNSADRTRWGSVRLLP